MEFPTPMDLFRDPITHYILGIYVLLMVWEALFPARRLVQVKFWKLKGIAVFIFYFFLSSYLPIIVAPFLVPYVLFDLTELGTAKGILAGIFIYESGAYCWHRLMHKSNFLWKTFHQMHHSAERLDTFGAYFFSPMDMIGWTLLSTFCFSFIAVLTPQAITATLLITNFLAVFQHANINTPRWLGYFIQRPESHTYHHAKNIHAGNYADLPLMDMIFGTFRNPKTFEHETGFYHGASGKITDMLLFRDINKKAG